MDPVRELYVQQQAAASVLAGSLGGMSQSGLLEDYTERRGGGGAAPSAAAASSVAATLETMIQLQQRLLSLTAAQQQQQQQQAAGMGLPAGPLQQQPAASVMGGGYRGPGGDDFGASPRGGLPDVDLQKSLQQLRQSQRYNVGGATPYAGGAAAAVGLHQPSHHHQAGGPGAAGGGYLAGSGALRDSVGSSYQSSTLDTYSAKKAAPYAPVMPGSYSAAGSSQVAGYFGSTTTYGAGGALATGGGSLGSAGGLARTNEYRKSSLGPTAPIPTSFSRTTSLGQLRPAGILKR